MRLKRLKRESRASSARVEIPEVRLEFRGPQRVLVTRADRRKYLVSGRRHRSDERFEVIENYPEERKERNDDEQNCKRRPSKNRGDGSGRRFVPWCRDADGRVL